MSKVFKGVCLPLFIFSIATCAAVDKGVGIAKEKVIPQALPVANKATPKGAVAQPTKLDPNYKSFTGKIVGNGVRLRLHPDLDSHIVKEVPKGDLLIVAGEKGDFYAVEPPADLKAYIFRSFVLDNIVEGNRVNVRLAPELNAPVIGYMNTGEKVAGVISEKNHKWLEIPVPKNVYFYVTKEYVEKVGGPELKVVQDKKRTNVTQLLDAADLLGQTEMMKPFEEIDFERVSSSYTTIINEYSEFQEFVEKAKVKLAHLQELYLQKKLAYLETKASKMSKELSSGITLTVATEPSEHTLTPKDRMRIWERIEEAQFLAWATSHHKKTIDDFYDDQKQEAIRISGIVEPYTDIVKNKPGSFIIRDRDMPKGYLYSTLVDLQNHVGKYVTVVVSPRPNNNFAFPAYFVLGVE